MNRLGLWLVFFGGLVVMNVTQPDAYALPKMAALGLGLALLWTQARAARRTALDGPVLALWIVALSSTLASGDWPTAVFGIYSQPYHGLMAMGFCTLALYAGATGGKDWFERALYPLSAALLAMSVFAFAQAAGVVPAPWALMGGRVISTSGSPILLGGVLCVAMPFLMHWTWRGRLVLLPVAAALLLTVSRGSIFAAVCGVGVYFVVMRQIRPRVFLLSALLAAVAVAGATMMRGERKISDAYRLEGLRVSARAVASAPLLGHGPDCFLNALRAHRDERYIKTIGNNYLLSAKGDFVQVAVTLGLLGLAAYLWLMLRIVACVRKVYDISEFFGQVVGSSDYRVAAAAAGSVAAAFVHAKWNQLPLEALVIVSFAVGVLCQREEEVPSSRAARVLRAVSLVVALVAVNVCAANVAMGKGVAAWNQRDFNRAAQMMRMAVYLAPWEIEYVTKRCEEIYLLARWVTPRESRDFMGRAIRASIEMTERSPGNASAWELLATTYWQAAQYLGPQLLRDAHRAIMRAQELDPLFEFTAERRRLIEADMARVLGPR